MCSAQTWANFAARGFALASQGQHADAARHWIEAAALQKNDERIGVPCSAFVQNNAGVGFGFLGDRESAHVVFGLARVQWETCLTSVPDEPIELEAKSSAHHMRLGSRHGDAFEAALRQRVMAMAVAGREIATWNEAMARGASAQIDLKALSDGLGDMSLAAMTVRVLRGEAPREALRDPLNRIALTASRLLAAAPASFSAQIERAAELSLLSSSLLFATLSRET